MYNKIKISHFTITTSFLFLLLIVSCSHQVNRYNEEASPADDVNLEENPLEEMVITTLVNTREHTMSTLYGNEAAFAYANASAESHYPDGSILYLVTWKQQEDALWFGARIPASISTVEKIKFQKDKQGNIRPAYTLYKGRSFVAAEEGSPAKVQERLAFILQEGAAVSP